MKKFFFALRTFLLVAIGIASYPSLEACTGMKLQAKDGAVVHGRTLEFGVVLPLSLLVIPRDYPFESALPNGSGLAYQSKYGCLGTIAFDQPAILDGINEKGLSVATFYFPGYAAYNPLSSQTTGKKLSPVEFPQWILTQFATLEEVKAEMSDITLISSALKEWGGIPPFHYIVYDREGNSLVIEPLKGQLILYENPFGLFTNSPNFDWHMTYLRNFITLKPTNPPSLTVNGVTLAPFGQGGGLVGMPGDFSSPSRFIQAAIFYLTAIPPKDAKEGIFQLFHILNHFDIPLGSVREVSKAGKESVEWTSITCVKDPHSLKYFFKTFANQTIQMVDLNQFNLKERTLKHFKIIEEKQAIYDLSGQFK